MDLGEFGESQIPKYERELADIEAEIDKISENPVTITQYRGNFQERIKTHLEVDKIQDMENLIKKIDLNIAKIRALATDQGRENLTKGENEQISKLMEVEELFTKKIKEKLKNYEIMCEFKRRKILNYKFQLNKYRFVETPSVQRNIAEILEHINLEIPVLVYGHLGAGKTEILKYVSKRFLGKEALGIGADPEIFSGHEYANPYDLFGKSQLGKVSEQEIDEIYAKNYEDYKNWLEKNPNAEVSEKRLQRMQIVYDNWLKNPANRDLSQEDKEKYKKILEEDIINEGKDVISFFQYGPMLRALKEGRPIILDEIDTIPKSILFRLNDLLVRKAGQKVKIQENGGEEFEIPKGFCILATANIKGEKYSGRTDLDAAFLSRFWSMEYNYLPQNEVQDIINAYLHDKRGNLLESALFPEKSLEEKTKLTPMEIQKEIEEKIYGPIFGTKEVKSLAEMAILIQKIFTGEVKKTSNLVGERNKPTTLEKTVLSMRALDHILRHYQEGRHKHYLEYYIFEEFIKPSATNKKDAIYLVELFCQAGYFKDWKEGDFNISGLTQEMIETAQGRKKG